MSDSEFPIVELIREAREQIAGCQRRLTRTAGLVARRRTALGKARERLEKLLAELVEPGSCFPLLHGNGKEVPVFSPSSAWVPPQPQGGWRDMAILNLLRLDQLPQGAGRDAREAWDAQARELADAVAFDLQASEYATVGDLADWIYDDGGYLEELSLTAGQLRRLRDAIHLLRERQGWPDHVIYPDGIPLHWLDPVVLERDATSPSIAAEPQAALPAPAKAFVPPRTDMECIARAVAAIEGIDLEDARQGMDDAALKTLLGRLPSQSWTPGSLGGVAWASAGGKDPRIWTGNAAAKFPAGPAPFEGAALIAAARKACGIPRPRPKPAVDEKPRSRKARKPAAAPSPKATA